MTSLNNLLFQCVVILLSTTLVSVHASTTAAGLETLMGIRGRDFVLLGADTAVGQGGGVVWTATAVDKIAVLQNNNDDNDQVMTAVAGDAADTDRLVGLLRAQAALYEYEQGPGTDVRYLRLVDMGGGDDEGTSKKLLSNHGFDHLTNDENGAATYTVTQVAQLARAQIAQQLRSRSPLRVALLVAGMQPGPAPSTTTTIQDDWTHRLQSQVQQASQLVVAKHGGTSDAGVVDDDEEEDDDDASQTPTTTSPSHPRLFWLDELGCLQDVPYAAQGIGSLFAHAILDQGYRMDMTRDEARALMLRCFAQLRQRYAIQAPRRPCLKLLDRQGVHHISLDDDYDDYYSYDNGEAGKPGRLESSL